LMTASVVHVTHLTPGSECQPYATVYEPGNYTFTPYNGIHDQKVVTGNEGRRYIVAEVTEETQYGESGLKEGIATPATTQPLSSSPSGAAAYDPAASFEVGGCKR
jgi:hypothetical protein